ncbi:IclR family transcriptional regulator [Halostella sp. JP-L12]|uniref:IclR family transcriptional regulator n=1 Tax=Halostella TaxID=1843185 RepID=UPI000EF7BBD2|nr:MULTISPECIES: IclR family transcriptional regulator [Halostella]NHN49364.1 IclR family transcriptional regulator [Halostella sp. JP-L12]
MVNAIRKSVRIIEALAEHQMTTISTLEKELEIPKSTLHRHLQTMEQEGLVVNEAGQYRLALRFLNFGEQARRQNSLLTIAEVELDDITEETGHESYLVVAEHGHAVYIYGSNQSQSVKGEIFPGKYTPLPATAAGRVLLAGMSLSTNDELLESDSSELPLQSIRNQNYALKTGDEETSRWEIAVPICNQDGHIQAAVSVSGDMADLGRETISDRLIERAQQAAHRIEIKSGYT